MNKEYRTEIRTLKAAAKKIRRERNASAKSLCRDIVQFTRAIARLNKELNRREANCTREEQKIINRIAVLEGRLS